MDDHEPTIKAALEYYRLVDPSIAQRIEKAVRDADEDAHDADIAYVDLAEAARRMVVDLHHDRSAREHVSGSISATPLTGCSSERRREVALEYLVRAAGGPDLFDCGMTVDEYLDRQDFEGAAWDEGAYVQRLAQLRLAL